MHEFCKYADGTEVVFSDIRKNKNGDETIWLTKSGGCIIANNNSKIPEKQLRKILDIIADNYFFIVSQWKEYFDMEDIKFYC